MTRFPKAFAFALCLAVRAPAQPGPAQQEARGVWIHTNDFDADAAKGREQIDRLVQNLADANFNLLLPFVNSDYLVALDHPEYQQKHPNAKWDALGYLIQQAEKRRLAVHLWYGFTGGRHPDSSDYDPKVGGSPKWAAKRVDEVVPGYPIARATLAAPGMAELERLPIWKMKQISIPLPESRPMRDVCPQHADARAWQLNLLRRALERYAWVSGIHVEEPGYTFPGSCVCDLCRSTFEILHHKKLLDNLDSLEAQDFRTLGTGAFMAELYTMLRNRDSRFQLSCNGSPNWVTDRRFLGRNWAIWAKLQKLSFFVPMNYTADPNGFRSRLDLTMKGLTADTPVYAGIGILWSGHPDSNISTATILNEIESSRRRGAKGVILFYDGALNNEIYDALKNGPFQSHVLLPNE